MEWHVLLSPRPSLFPQAAVGFFYRIKWYYDLMAPVDRIFRWFLLLVAVHTFGVGVVLIVSGNTIMTFFGFPYLESRFFQMQGGVFHLLVSYVYYKASTDLRRYEYLIVFSIVIKMTASVFLFSYYIFIEQIIMVLLSGFIDFGMGVIILLFYRKLKLP